MESISQSKKGAKLGEILVSQNYLQMEQLQEALDKQKHTGLSLGAQLIQLKFIDEDTLSGVLGKQIEINQRKRIGEILVDQGYINNEQLSFALNEQKKLGIKLGKVIVHLGYIDESKLLDVLAAQMDFQHVVLENFSFDKNIIKLIPEEMARSYKAIPLYKKQNILTIATSDPTNLRSLDHIKFKTGLSVEPVIATEAEISEAIEKQYAGSNQVLAELLNSGSNSEFEVVENQDEDDEQLGDEEGQQVIKIVNLIVTEAVREGASDIHLEPQESGMSLRYRIDGELIEKKPIPNNYMSQVTSRLKILSGMDIAERRKPLDGRFTIRHKGTEVDLRVSTFPTMLRGKGVIEKMVIRILSFDVSKVDLKKMGLSKQVYQLFTEEIKRPNGIVLVTGPTGSGKSSTLYSCIKHVMGPKINIMTMEDPVEMNLPGVNQGQINIKAGFTFASGMRAILRQDPDIIMLGEIRDEETARMAIQAALTGHMVYSTLHTNDSAEAFTRMLDMGIEPFLLNASIRAVMAQRLVRKICKRCKTEVHPSKEILKSIGIREGTTFYEGKGCQVCQNTGFKGRLGIFEILVPDETINSMVYNKASSKDIKNYAIKERGMATLRRDGLEKALAGLTTLEQVLSVS